MRVLTEQQVADRLADDQEFDRKEKIRNRFAGLAMQGLLANRDVGLTDEEFARLLAYRSFQIAEEMMEYVW